MERRTPRRGIFKRNANRHRYVLIAGSSVADRGKEELGMRTKNWLGTLAVVTAVAAMVPVALADLSEEVYKLEACHYDDNGSLICVTTYVVPQEAGETDPETGVYRWVLESDELLQDLQGNDIGVLQGRDPETQEPRSYIEVIPADGRNPEQVNLGFAVQAGQFATTFSFASTKVTVDPAIPGSVSYGEADAVFNVSDDGDDYGATLTGLLPGGGAVRPQYNGFPTGTLFKELMDPIYADPYSSAPGNDSYAAAIGETVEDISLQIDFELTPYDFASGSATFEVTPEPSALLLLGSVLVVLRRR